VPVPAQPVGHSGALADQGFAVIGQQSNLPVRTVKPSGGQPRLAQENQQGQYVY
jgi:hypothetical protein